MKLFIQYLIIFFVSASVGIIASFILPLTESGSKELVNIHLKSCPKYSTVTHKIESNKFGITYSSTCVYRKE